MAVDTGSFITLADLEQTSIPTSYGPGASGDVHVPHRAAMGRQPPLPEMYRLMTAGEVDARIAEAKQTLGNRLVILGHHYQRDEIIKFADFRGDSFKLSQQAATRRQAQFIVFCGVHFMAESADVLSGPEQTVILPNLTAGCSMADMANLADVTAAWDRLGEAAGTIIPVTYMNSTAALKAFCGERGGIVCTSSNAPLILRWAFECGRKVLFFPDEHLGRNTADRIGLAQEEVSVWNPRDPEASFVAAATAKLVVWRGFCSVHERFTVDQIAHARHTYPGCTVIVHPECRREVVGAADANGSTEFIIEAVEAAAPGTTLAIGTEINLVNRLATKHPDKTVFCLDPIVCPCSTMYRIHPAYLAWALDNLLDGRVVNQIQVPAETAQYARLALDRMLKAGQPSVTSAMAATAAA
ncbi:MAG TPA: quinolinate synthase NadA [Chloroflexota bacterium]|nr:quinolinate synthase NadA [Chloroflexota bacterium]